MLSTFPVPSYWVMPRLLLPPLAGSLGSLDGDREDPMNPHNLKPVPAWISMCVFIYFVWV